MNRKERLFQLFVVYVVAFFCGRFLLGRVAFMLHFLHLLLHLLESVPGCFCDLKNGEYESEDETKHHEQYKAPEKNSQ